jgi:tetratricopeptide (TPR) repeat protein
MTAPASDREASRSAFEFSIVDDQGASLFEGSRRDLEFELLEAAHEAYQRGNFHVTSTAVRAIVQVVNPDSFLGWYAVGILHAGRKEWEAACAAMHTAIELVPAALHFKSRMWRSELYFNLGNCYQALVDVKRARRYFERSIELHPRPEALSNLGNVYLQIGQPAHAIRCYHKARTVDPSGANSEFNLALAELLTGNLELGFTHYEARWRMPEHLAEYGRPDVFSPRWEGEPLAGRHLFLWAEQGQGDTIQMLQCLPPAAFFDGPVTLEVQQSLVRLARENVGRGMTVIGRGDPVPDHDVNLPLLSLPHLLKLSLDRLPVRTSYLRVPPSGPRFPEGTTASLRVGVSWAGNPRHSGDRQRSIAFDLLRPLFEIPEIDVVSLQFGPRSADAPPWIPTLEGIGCTDFVDTAHAIWHLDLVVTVDTAIAHLAGALGIPCWVILPPAPDWRWLLGRDDSPWYPSIRLFRRTRHDEWSDTIDRICGALRSHRDRPGEHPR